jgi:dTDP-4-amino-4,6-dideoxygalactose transaminase
MTIANECGIRMLEDAAEALGSEYHGRKCGTFGEFACLSFNGNKMITTSGGGALVCRTAEEAARTKFFATQARDKAPHYQHSHIGYNYRMSNICAGIGRGQMYVLEDHIARVATLMIAMDLNYITKDKLERLKPVILKISNQLNGLKKSLNLNT